MKYKNYIWDFDGTLFDSYPHLMDCLEYVLNDEGIEFDRDMTYRQLLVSFGSMKEYTKISDETYRRFVALEHRTGDEEFGIKAVPFEDCEKVLSAITEAGGKNFIYTHRNHTLFDYFEKYGLTKYFTGYVTSEDGFPSKPAPDAVLSIISKYSLNPDETIMVGDREIDGMSGKNAGIAGALVNYPKVLPDGTSPADRSAMDYTAQSLTEFALKVKIL